MRILKGLSGIIYLVCVSLFHFRRCSLLIREYRSTEEKIGAKNYKYIEKISMYLEDDWQNQLILPAKFSRDRGDFCFQDGKSWISILHCNIFFLLKNSFSIASLLLRSTLFQHWFNADVLDGLSKIVSDLRVLL